MILNPLKVNILKLKDTQFSISISLFFFSLIYLQRRRRVGYKMSQIYPILHHYLVDHPTIRHFEWNQTRTIGASSAFLTLTVLTYITLTLLLSHFSKSIPTVPPTLLRLITTVHNFILLLLSLTMSVGTSLSISSLPSISSLFCFHSSSNHIPPRGPLFFWAYIFYLSKLLEFVDTLLIILSSSSNRRLSFLHVYHHAIVVILCYVWLYTSMSLFPVALVTNASVHVLMYAYYLLCAVGIRPRWKRAVTDCQIVQFVFSFAVSGVMLYYHFTGIGCSGIWGWCFNAVFNASLLYLFVDFHLKNYAKRKMGSSKVDKRS